MYRVKRMVRGNRLADTSFVRTYRYLDLGYFQENIPPEAGESCDIEYEAQWDSEYIQACQNKAMWDAWRLNKSIFPRKEMNF